MVAAEVATAAVVATVTVAEFVVVAMAVAVAVTVTVAEEQGVTAAAVAAFASPQIRRAVTSQVPQK